MTCRATYHEGRALVLWTDTQMLLLCPYGHLYQAWPAGPEFGGSKAAIYATDPPIVRCNGVPPRALAAKHAWARDALADHRRDVHGEGGTA